MSHEHTPFDDDFTTTQDIAERARRSTSAQHAADDATNSGKVYSAPSDTRNKPVHDNDRLSSSVNYNPWIRQMTAHLRAYGGSVITVWDGAPRVGNEEQVAIWDTCDRVAYTFISLALAPSINYLVDEAVTASMLRVVIQRQFAPNDTQGVIRQYESLFSLRLTSTSIESVDAYIKSYKEASHFLTAAKVGLPASVHSCQSRPPSVRCRHPCPLVTPPVTLPHPLDPRHHEQGQAQGPPQPFDHFRDDPVRGPHPASLDQHCRPLSHHQRKSG